MTAPHAVEHEPLVEDPMGVGVHNYCAMCRDRVCLECRVTDVFTGGGSWMSGHCFNCQSIVGERQAQQRRQDEMERQRERRAEAWDEGANSVRDWIAAGAWIATMPTNPYRSAS